MCCVPNASVSAFFTNSLKVLCFPQYLIAIRIKYINCFKIKSCKCLMFFICSDNNNEVKKMTIKYDTISVKKNVKGE